MSTLVDLKAYRAAKRKVFFHRDELRALMNLYSRRVMTGEWKDYAMDFGQGLATFTVFRHTFDAPLYSIIKLKKRSGGEEWMVFSGKERLKRAASLTDVLTFFEKKLKVVR